MSQSRARQKKRQGTKVEEYDSCVRNKTIRLTLSQLRDNVDIYFFFLIESIWEIKNKRNLWRNS